MQCCEAEGSKSQDAARPDEARRRQDAAGRTDKEHSQNSRSAQSPLIRIASVTGRTPSSP